MSKSTLLAPAAVATTVPITFLASSGQGIRQLIPKLTSAMDIKEKYKEVDCLKEYFGTITFNGTTANPLQSSHINDFDSNSKSCLIVEYNKKTYSNNKWHGEFRFIWAIKDNNQGLITITNARTKNDGRLWGNSAAYALKKNETGNSWDTSYKQEISERTKDNNTGLQNLIPQASSILPGTPNTTKYWGFDPSMDNICKTDECPTSEIQTINNSYSWELIGNGQGSEVSSWTTNIENWLNKIFSWKELTNKIKQVKGTWNFYV